MTQPTPDATLERVRKLLAKAEAVGVTEAEAEALTGKAAELMAKHGIDRALLGAAQPETDQPADKVFTIPDPWARVRGHLLAGIASAMRCQCVQLPGGDRIHVFGYASDLERVEVMYTSLLLQMAHGLRRARPDVQVRSIKAWRRSWMLGFITSVTQRVRAAEAAATRAADEPDGQAASGGKSAALVLVDRETVIKRSLKEAYPLTRKTRITYSGSGYGSGHAAGSRANIGGTGVGRRTAGAIGR